MEAVGLAIGVAGLAALFDTCLGVFDRVGSYKDFGRDAHYLSTRLKAEKLRFEQWGRAVGIADAEIADAHHPALNDPHVRSTARDLLYLIQEISLDTGDALPSQHTRGNTKIGEAGVSSAVQAPSNSETSRSKGRKLLWALGGKEKAESLVEKLAALVSLLLQLVPSRDIDGNPPGYLPPPTSQVLSVPAAENPEALGQQTDGHSNQGGWIHDVRHALQQIEEKTEGKIPYRNISLYLKTDSHS